MKYKQPFKFIPYGGVVHNMDHEVVTCPRPFFYGHTSMVQFLRNAILKSLGPH